MLALLLSGCGGDGGSDGPIDETFRNPPELKSIGGELRTTFNVASTRFQVGGRTVTSAVYNGSYIPPVLRLRPGDTLHLELDNRSDEPTNIHYHGLNVSPRINADATVSDNIFVLVDPGGSSTTASRSRQSQPGLYWFHTHRHELAQRQVMGGLSGGLVIEGVLDPFRELAGIRERIMLLKDIQITPQGTVPEDIDPSAPSIRTVNGQVNPTMTIRPNETQFLRIANIGSDLYYQIWLDGHVFHEIARDGNRHATIVAYGRAAAAARVTLRGADPGRAARGTLCDACAGVRHRPGRRQLSGDGPGDAGFAGRDRRSRSRCRTLPTVED